MDKIREAIAPIMAWWDAHEAATPSHPLSDDQCVMYYNGIRVTAKHMRDLKAALKTDAQPQQGA